MKQKFKHRPELQIEAEFSEENPPVFRYKLSATKIGAGGNPKTVCAVMQNPSYACIEFADGKRGQSRFLWISWLLSLRNHWAQSQINFSSC